MGTYNIPSEDLINTFEKFLTDQEGDISAYTIAACWNSLANKYDWNDHLNSNHKEDRNILQQAHEIIYDRLEEDDRKYGPMKDNINDAAKIASVLRNKEIIGLDVLACLIGIKFSRERFSHKRDNILDAVAYLASYNDQLEEK